MTKQKFSTSSINQLIDDSIAEADQFKNELQTINESDNSINFNEAEIEDDYLMENEKTFAEKRDIISNEDGGSVQYQYIYKKIGDLIDAGNSSIQMLQSIDPDTTDPSVLAATGTLINSIRGCISEFTKIHQQWLRYKQQVSLEKIRLTNRMEFYKYKNDLNKGLLGKSSSEADLFELGSSDLIEFLQWKKEKAEKEKEKENKI